MNATLTKPIESLPEVGSDIKGIEAFFDEVMARMRSQNELLEEQRLQIEHLQAENDRHLQLRETYIQALRSISPAPDFTITADELRDMRENGLTYDQLKAAIADANGS